MILKNVFKIFFPLVNFIIFSSQAQEKDSLSKQFLMNIEIRPTTEYTSNYTHPPNTTIDPYFYITQRNRISMQYEREKWLIRSDIQEIHLWDEENSASKVGSINFNQLFLETKFKSLKSKELEFAIKSLPASFTILQLKCFERFSHNVDFPVDSVPNITIFIAKYDLTLFGKNFQLEKMSLRILVAETG